MTARTTLKQRARARLLTALSGDPNGTPAWVAAIAEGDDDGYFGPNSAAWVVHGGMATMVAGIRALLMQTLHPGAMAGVAQHSRYQSDPLGRLAGTIQWLITVTFGDRALAERESHRVTRLHERVRGSYPTAYGEREYRASDPDLGLWVHAVFTDAFLGCHQVWGGDIPGGADAYVREWAQAGRLVGVLNPPESVAELRACIDGFRNRGELRRDERVDETLRFLRRPPLGTGAQLPYRLLFAGAVASLPDDYREMLGLKRPNALARWATARTLTGIRWLLGPRSTSEEAARARLVRIGALSTQSD